VRQVKALATVTPSVTPGRNEGVVMPAAKRAPVHLSDFKVKALKPDTGEYIQGDLQVPGLGVRVRPSGAASYVVMKRLPGQTKPTRITLGRVGDLTLQDAREKARDAIAATRQGVRVNAEKRRERTIARQVEAETGYQPGSFGESAERYIRSECKVLARGADVAAIIRRHLLPPWGERPLDELRRRDLTALLDPIVESGRTQSAHKLREVAIRIVNWAIDRGDIELNFLATASRGRRRAGILRRTRRDRVLSDDEIRAIWQACDHVGWPFRDFVRLALMLGQRREEIAAMEWTELDLKRQLWVIPAERYKTRVEHAVPLPASAVELICSMPRLCDRFVFSTAPGTHFSGFSKLKARLDELSGVSGWRIHDLRRTMRTNLAGLRVDPDTAERVLGHVIGGVRGVYDRYAYLDEKREALDRWAARLRGIVDPSPENVIELRAASVF
jgi:integrase